MPRRVWDFRAVEYFLRDLHSVKASLSAECDGLRRQSVYAVKPEAYDME